MKTTKLAKTRKETITLGKEVAGEPEGAKQLKNFSESIVYSSPSWLCIEINKTF